MAEVAAGGAARAGRGGGRAEAEVKAMLGGTEAQELHPAGTCSPPWPLPWWLPRAPAPPPPGAAAGETRTRARGGSTTTRTSSWMNSRVGAVRYGRRMGVVRVRYGGDVHTGAVLDRPS